MPLSHKRKIKDRVSNPQAEHIRSNMSHHDCSKAKRHQQERWSMSLQTLVGEINQKFYLLERPMTSSHRTQDDDKNMVGTTKTIAVESSFQRRIYLNRFLAHFGPQLFCSQSFSSLLWIDRGRDLLWLVDSTVQKSDRLFVGCSLISNNHSSK